MIIQDELRWRFLGHIPLENGLKWYSASIIIAFVHTSAFVLSTITDYLHGDNTRFLLNSVSDARMSSKFKEELCHEVGCCVCACFDHHVKFVYSSALQSTDLPLRLY
jgi:hypothetical protein